METKSRYEVISELEAQKRSMIRERENLNEILIQKEKGIKLAQRNIDDQKVQDERHRADLKEDYEQFKNALKDKQATADLLIKSLDDSLKRFTDMQKKE